MISIIIILFICLISSGFFSAAETALTGASRPFLLHKEKQGVKRAKLVNKILNDPNALITSMLVGNNFANVFFTTFLSAFAFKFFGNQNPFLLGIGITVIILIFAEILPKTYAFTNPNRTSLTFGPIIYFMLFILKPISYIFLKINKFLLLYVFPHKNNQSHEQFASLESLRGAIEMLKRDESKQDITLQEKAMLHSILDLKDLSVSSILNHRKNVMVININDKKEDILERLFNSPYTRVPVFKNTPENIIGVINVKEVFRAYLKNSKNINIKSLINDPYFIPETTYVIDLLAAFKVKQERMALIVDEYGSFMGIITLGDIMEEIAGDINNKDQENLNDKIQKDQDSHIVAGDLKIRDLNRKMNWRLPDEDFTTIAGLILYETGKIPNVGSIFILHDVKFEVLEKVRHQLVKIKITPLIKDKTGKES
ncbi:Mg2+ and Co2+ transporter CorB [Candidatus Hepatincolaceae symbiont of Richtersius coronifer]